MEIQQEALKTLNNIAFTLINLNATADKMLKTSIANIVYPHDTIQTLFSEFRSLCDARTEANHGVSKASKELKEKFGAPKTGDFWSFGALSAKLDHDDAVIQYEGVSKAIELRNETTKAYDEFREKHPLVVDLYNVAFPVL